MIKEGAIARKLRHPGLLFDWLSGTFFDHLLIRMLGFLRLFALRYVKTAFLLTNQN